MGLLIVWLINREFYKTLLYKTLLYFINRGVLYLTPESSVKLHPFLKQVLSIIFFFKKPINRLMRRCRSWNTSSGRKFSHFPLAP
jgi:hypothetical protein